MQSEQETGQAEGLTAASEGGAFTFDSAAADDVLKSALQANPFGDMLDSLLRHQPTSHKLSDLYTKPATVDDPVNRALQGVIAHVGAALSAVLRPAVHIRVRHVHFEHVGSPRVNVHATAEVVRATVVFHAPFQAGSNTSSGWHQQAAVHYSVGLMA